MAPPPMALLVLPPVVRMNLLDTQTAALAPHKRAIKKLLIAFSLTDRTIIEEGENKKFILVIYTEKCYYNPCS
jgi:hypothetical protein